MMRRRNHGDVRRVDGVGRPKFDFHTGWAEGGVYRKSIEDGPMRAALERLWASQRDQANKGFEALVAADIAADGDGKWWLRHEKRYGPSRFVGVTMQSGRWKVMLTVDGKLVHVGMCDNEEDAARLVDLLLVRVRREAPRNFPKAFGEFFETGCDGDVPAELVAAAKEALRRVGRVDVKETDDGAEARDALASAEKEIEEAWDHPLASEDLSGVLPRGQRDRPRANWTVDQGKFMEAVTVEDGPENVLELALVDVNNREVAMALTRASTYGIARRMLWRLKRSAADLLDVELDDKPPPLQKPAERTPAHQRALDVASRWAASRAGTVDADLATKYAEALAAIARDCVAKQQKKKKRRR